MRMRHRLGSRPAWLTGGLRPLESITTLSRSAQTRSRQCHIGIAVLTTTILTHASALAAAPLCLPREDPVVTAGSGHSLEQALKEIACGTTLLLAPGAYGGEAEVRADCAADQLLVIRSDPPLGARLTGKLRVLGQHALVSDLTVDGGRIEVRGAFNRVTRNKFHTAGGLVVGATIDSRIDHNEFATPSSPGIDFAFKFSKSDRRPARSILVDHNLFRSIDAGGDDRGDNEEEDGSRHSVGIYLGEFSARRGRQDMLDYGKVGVVVEQNLFIDYHRRKAIHIKSLGNIIRNNTFVDTKQSSGWSRVTIRSGQFNEITDNLMDGTTGLQIFEEHNSASGNVLTNGATLVVMGGGGEITQFDGPQQRAAVDTKLVSNAGPLAIGVTYERRPNKTPATGTVVENHDGPIEKLLELDTVVRGGGTPRAATGSRMEPRQVGPSAPDPNCPSP